MNKKNQKILIILGIVLAAVCIVYVVLTRAAAAKEAKEESESAAQSEAARVFVTDMDDVNTIILNTGETELRFVKNDDTWDYDGDDKFPVNQDILKTIAEAAGNFEADRKLENGDSLDAYGFADDNVSVTAKDSAGTEVTLVYGDAVGDGYYVKTSDSDTVYTAGSTLYSQFQGKTLYDFVQEEALPTTFSDDIMQVKLTFDGKTYTYDKPAEEESDTSESTEAENDTSESTETESGAAESETESETKSPEAEAFDNLAAAIPGMSIEKCADYYADKTELKKYGLDKPKMTIEYTYTDSDGNEKTQIIYVGSTAEKENDADADAYYVRLEGSDMVNTISANSIDGLKGYVEK